MSDESLEDRYFNSDVSRKCEEQSIPLPCWGRLNCEMPSYVDIFIPCHLLQKQTSKSNPLKGGEFPLQFIDTESTKKPAFSSYPLTEERENSLSQYETEDTSNSANFNICEDQIQDTVEAEQPNFESYSIALPRKVRDESPDASRTAKSKKKKKPPQENSFAKFFEHRKDAFNLHKSRYVFNIDPSVTESATYTPENVSRAVGHKEDLPDVHPVNDKVSETADEEPVGGDFISLQSEQSVGAVTDDEGKILVLENVPKDADQEGVEMLLCSYGTIKTLEWLDAGKCYVAR